MGAPVTREQATVRLAEIEEQLHLLMADCTAAGFTAAADAIDHIVAYHTDAVREGLAEIS
jgi:hypothetical protein